MLTTDFANFENFVKLRTAVYPSKMALIGTKLGQNAFQTIPDISLLDAGNKNKSICLQTLKIRLPPEDGSDWPETLGKRVSGNRRKMVLPGLNLR